MIDVWRDYGGCNGGYHHMGWEWVHYLFIHNCCRFVLSYFSSMCTFSLLLSPYPPSFSLSLSSPYLFQKGSILNNRIFIMFLSLIILFPLCYLRRINSLRHASGLAILAFLYMSSLVVISYVPLKKRGE